MDGNTTTTGTCVMGKPDSTQSMSLPFLELNSMIWSMWRYINAIPAPVVFQQPTDFLLSFLQRSHGRLATRGLTNSIISRKTLRMWGVKKNSLHSSQNACKLLLVELHILTLVPLKARLFFWKSDRKPSKIKMKCSFLSCKGIVGIKCHLIKAVL